MGPKRAKLAQAEKAFKDAMDLLGKKKAELAEVIELVDKLVEESALYVVDDGPRARLYRLT